MGFDVEIGPDVQAFTRRLMGAPSTVFKEPFAGYLLFLFDLVSDSDAALTKWFRMHAEPLDAMTGKDVAFAVLAHRVHVHIHVPHGGDSRPPGIREATLGDMDLDVDIRRLVRSGRFGWVADGDEIQAVNEAVYDLARELGIMHKLPCVVAFDGLPDPRIPYKTLSLVDADLGELYGGLRRAIGRLQAIPSLSSYQTGLKTILDRTEERNKLQAEWDRAEVRRARRTGRVNATGWTERDAADLFRHWRRQIEVALRHGDEPLLARSLGFLGQYHPDERFAEGFRAEFYPTSKNLKNALREVHRALEMQWPIEQTENEKLKEISQTVRDSIPSGMDTMPSLESRQEAAALQREIAQARVLFVARAMEELPSLTQWMEWWTRGYERSVHVANTMEHVAEGLRWHEQLQAERNRLLAETDLAIHDTARTLLAMPGRPSWCKLLEEEFERTRGKTVPASDEGAASILDWAQLPESLYCLRRMDYLGLLGLCRKVVSEFGRAVWTRPPTAFASYASADRDEVIRRVQGMRAFQSGLDVFLDFHSLCPGEVWRVRLDEEIARRDRFFLFWSRAASRSSHVTEEWQTALRKGKSITPVPLCSPQEAPPPRELANLHFGDYFTEFLRCMQARPPAIA